MDTTPMTALADGQPGTRRRHVYDYAHSRVGRFFVRRRTLFAALMPWLVFAVARPTLPLYAAGLGLLVLGCAIRVWASGHLHKDQRLATGGPYAYCQHPLYCASLIQAGGVGVMGGRVEAAIGLLVLFVLLYRPTIAAEERMLQDVFGAEYQDYRQRVPRFVPRLTRAALPESRFSWRQVAVNREHANLVGAALVALLLALAAGR
jgi:protein-S-isoprenylcysteine O-methyltransferase Ste14